MNGMHTPPQHIKGLDYSNLVSILSTSITPEFRSVILEKLTEINNRLLQNSKGTPNVLNKQYDTTLTPSYFDNYNYQCNNNASNYQRTSIYPITMGTTIDPTIFTTNNPFMSNDYSDNRRRKDVDLDDIIGDMDEEGSDDLDSKLKYIKDLHNKLVSEKRSRRREKSNKKNN